MPLTLLPLTPTHFNTHPSLLHRIAYIHQTAFLTNAVYAAINPSGYSDSLVASSMERHRAAILNDPTIRYLAVLDADISPTSSAQSDRLSPDCENVIAFGKYYAFESGREQDDRQDTAEHDWPAEMNHLVLDAFWGQIRHLRVVWGAKLGPHVQVDVVATDPAHMRRGAGLMIMTAIAARADELGLPGFLEGSPEGVPVYQRVGFGDTGERVRLDLGRYVGKFDRGVDWREREGVVLGKEKAGKAEGWYENVIMVRPAKGKRLEVYLR